MMPKSSHPPEASYAAAAWMLDCDVAAIMAVGEVESGRYGAWLPSGEPVILYEPHVFSKLTNHKFDATHPELSYPRWNKNGYGKNSEQHPKLAAAAKLDRDAAFMSCSWGLFQIMGHNYRRAGHHSLQSFINAAYRDVDSHLRMFVHFILSSEALTQALQDHDWPTFKRIYNGPGANDYAERMAAAYARLNTREE